MYNEIYKKLCSTVIAYEHPGPVWRDKNGEGVESEEQAFRCKSEFELIHAAHLIFVDEVGSNKYYNVKGLWKGNEDQTHMQWCHLVVSLVIMHMHSSSSLRLRTFPLSRE